MNTITRTTTLRRLNRRFTAYEPLDKTTKQLGQGPRGWRAFSTRRKTTPFYGQLKTQNYNDHDQDQTTTMSPVVVSDRRDRARSRHIFLQGYKLSMYTTQGKLKSNNHMKLKKAMVKVKTMVVSVLSLMRAASLKRCNSKSAIAASSPTRIHRCF